MRNFFPSGEREVREARGREVRLFYDNFFYHMRERERERESTRGDSGGGEVRDKMNPCGH